MPIVEFQSTRTGRVIERLLDQEELARVKIGALTEFGGESYRRLPPRFAANVREHGHTAYSRPQHHPYAPRVDANGFAVFANKHEVREFEAKTGERYDRS